MSKNRRRRSTDTIDLFPPVVRCPVCQGPRQARLGRFGPYFHCRCVEIAARARPAAAKVERKILVLV